MPIFNKHKVFMRLFDVLLICSTMIIVFPGILLAADNVTLSKNQLTSSSQSAVNSLSLTKALDTTGAVDISFYADAGKAAQSQVKATGKADGGVTLEFYLSHPGVWSPEEKVYYNNAFGLN